MESIYRKAYAKINLSLDVTGRRPNGYHDVCMVMQTIDLYDELEFWPLDEKAAAKKAVAEAAAEEFHVDLTIETDSGPLSAGEDNLICRAAMSLLHDYRNRWCNADRNTKVLQSLPVGVKIHLKKHIPIAAGMAGGSTDAAAAFLGINDLFGLGYTKEDLCRLGGKLGADIPFCIMGGTVLAEGIGEILTPLPDAPDMILAVAKPEIGVSTKYVYETLDTLAGWKQADGAAAENASESAAKNVSESDAENAVGIPAKKKGLCHPDVAGQIEAIRRGDAKEMIRLFGNVLEEVTIPACPVVQEIKDVFIEEGCLGTLMSGSGPTVFAAFETEEAARAAIQKAGEKQLANQTFVTHLMRFQNEAEA